ncbi:MAG: hypothetical protein ACYCXP_02755 [Leptospirillum sp.]|jgi:hypothetical protein
MKIQPDEHGDSFNILDILLGRSRLRPIPRIPDTASHHVSVEAVKWYASFSSDDGQASSKEEDTIAWSRIFLEEELRIKTVGFDRGRKMWQRKLSPDSKKDRRSKKRPDNAWFGPSTI